MKIAIVGIGGVARYLIDELAPRHEIIAISRSHKSFLDALGITQYQTAYTLAGIAPILKDCNAVICTVTGAAPDLVGIHSAILDACQNSPTCKKFIPSAWVGNFEDVPDQPFFGSGNIQQIYRMLTQQAEVEWTFIALGWMADYILPTHQRYLPDIGDCWVQNHQLKTFTLYGNGTQTISFTAGPDVARAVRSLLETEVAWEHITYMSGQQLTWYELWEIISSQDPAYRLQRKSLSSSIKQLIEEPKDEWRTLVATFEIMGHSEALKYPQYKVDKHRAKYFPDIKFRTIGEVLQQAVL